MDFRALAEATGNRCRPKIQCSTVRMEKVVRVLREDTPRQAFHKAADIAARRHA